MYSGLVITEFVCKWRVLLHGARVEVSDIMHDHPASIKIDVTLELTKFSRYCYLLIKYGYTYVIIFVRCSLVVALRPAFRTQTFMALSLCKAYGYWQHQPGKIQGTRTDLMGPFLVQFSCVEVGISLVLTKVDRRHFSADNIE